MSFRPRIDAGDLRGGRSRCCVWRDWTSRRAAKTERAHSLRSQLHNRLELSPPFGEPERYQGELYLFCRTANQPSRRRRRARRHGVANDDPTRPLPPLPLYPSKLVSHSCSQPRQSDHRCVFYLDRFPTSSYLAPCDTQFPSQPGSLYIHPLPIAPHRHQHVSRQQALDRGRRPQGQARPHSR